MDWSDFLFFLLGNVSFPILLFFLGKINPDATALAIVTFLEKLFKDKQLRNKVSNLFGIKLVKIGIALITVIEDDKEKVKELIIRLKALIDELEQKLIEAGEV